MRLATWNVNSLKARLDRVLAWTQAQQPDILCLQETKLTDVAMPALDFATLGYEVAHHGLGQWNGVAVVSRVGLEVVQVGLPEGAEGWTDEGGRFLAADCGGIRVASVYVPNGRVVGSEFYDAKLAWLDALVGWTAAQPVATEMALCGDFNVAPTDRDVWDPAAVHGATHVSGPERERVQALLDVGLTDILARFHPEPGYFTWWDYRGGNFHKNLGMRIDHVLASATLAARATAADRDRDARKPSTYPGIPSDHAPVVVDFA